MVIDPLIVAMILALSLLLVIFGVLLPDTFKREPEDLLMENLRFIARECINLRNKIKKYPHKASELGRRISKLKKEYNKTKEEYNKIQRGRTKLDFPSFSKTLSFLQASGIDEKDYPPVVVTRIPDPGPRAPTLKEMIKEIKKQLSA